MLHAWLQFRIGRGFQHAVLKIGSLIGPLGTIRRPVGDYREALCIVIVGGLLLGSKLDLKSHAEVVLQSMR